MGGYRFTRGLPFLLGMENGAGVRILVPCETIQRRLIIFLPTQRASYIPTGCLATLLYLHHTLGTPGRI